MSRLFCIAAQITIKYYPNVHNLLNNMIIQRRNNCRALSYLLKKKKKILNEWYFSRYALLTKLYSAQCTRHFIFYTLYAPQK